MSVGADQEEETGAERVDGVSPRCRIVDGGKRRGLSHFKLNSGGHLLERAQPRKNKPKAVTNVSPLHMFLWDSRCCSGRRGALPDMCRMSLGENNRPENMHGNSHTLAV